MFDLRPLLLESSVIVIFYVIFLMRYTVIIDYHFGKKNSNQEKTGGKQLFWASNFVWFYYCCFQIKIRIKRKGKINLETKYNTIWTNQTLNIKMLQLVME